MTHRSQAQRQRLKHTYVKKNAISDVLDWIGLYWMDVLDWTIGLFIMHKVDRNLNSDFLNFFDRGKTVSF